MYNPPHSHRVHFYASTNTLIFAHKLFAFKNYIRAVIFCVVASASLVTQAMDNANMVKDAPQSRASLSALLHAQREAVEPLLDKTLACLATANQNKRYLQGLLMGAAQAGRDTKNSAIRVRLIIKLLLDRGADPLEPDKFGATVFSQSCSISSYPIIKNIIYGLMMGTLDPNHQSNASTAPLLWQMMELATKYPMYQLVKTALECDANPDTLNEVYESLLDRFLPKKEQFFEAKRSSEYSMLVRLLYRFGATTNQTNLHAYFNEQEVQELEHERCMYRADEAYLLGAYRHEHPALSKKPLEELYVLKLQEFSPVQTPTPLVNLIADYSEHNSFARKRTPTL